MAGKSQILAQHTAMKNLNTFNFMCLTFSSAFCLQTTTEAALSTKREPPSAWMAKSNPSTLTSPSDNTLTSISCLDFQKPSRNSQRTSQRTRFSLSGSTCLNKKVEPRLESDCQFESCKQWILHLRCLNSSLTQMLSFQKWFGKCILNMAVATLQL